MATVSYTCPYCKRSNFKSQKGLTQHQQNKPECLSKLRAEFGVGFTKRSASHFVPLAPVVDLTCASNATQHSPTSEARINSNDANLPAKPLVPLKVGHVQKSMHIDETFPSAEHDAINMSIEVDDDSTSSLGNNSSVIALEVNNPVNTTFCQ